MTGSATGLHDRLSRTPLLGQSIQKTWVYETRVYVLGFVTKGIFGQYNPNLLGSQAYTFRRPWILNGG